MKTDLSQNEIDKLEEVLNDFKDELEKIQSQRASTWRFQFLMSFICALVMAMLDVTMWWVGIVVIGYFAGSLFVMLRQRAKTDSQIIEHQKQLKLVRLLRNFQSSPYSKE